MYTRSVFRPSSTPFLPLFLPLSGDHTIHSFGGDRLPFKISGNTHRALDTTTSTHEEVTTRWRPLSWGRLFCLFSSYKWRLVFVRARRRRRLATVGGPVERSIWIARYLSAFFLSFILGLSLPPLVVAFSRKCTQND